ncbi:MAG TPA: response regulator [Methylomirabilota bacterium]|nr:response regulator [Methylomirabilota bacterium]
MPGVIPLGRVLIVDDDPALLEALPQTLTLRGEPVAVETCDGALAALARIAATDYDAIVTDVKMPGMDGLTLLAEIRRRRPDTPTLLITGHADHELAIRALRAGAYDYIPKPIDREYFLVAVRRAVRTRQLAREVETQRRELASHSDRLEEVVAERTRELTEANQAKDEFLAVLSHELRTPLTPILTWAQIIRHLSDPARVRQAADVIERNVRLQIALVEDLLDLTRITQGRLPLDLKPHDLRAIVRGSVEVLAEAAGQKRIRIELVEPGVPIAVEGDRERLERVFLNLLSNAVKFTSDGGAVRVTLQREAEAAVVTVHDDGVGIDPGFLPQIFQMFRQQEQGARRQYGGLGVGLNLAKRLAELHRGQIEVRSAGVGRGTEVTVRLPLLAAPADRAEPAAVGTRLDGVRILIVEDSADTGDATRLLLEDLGARVQLAKDGLEALDILAADEPDVVLCDLRMPGLDGFEFVRRLRADPRRAHVPVVAVSGFARKADFQRTEEAGFDGHVSKPFDLEVLLAALACAVQRRQPGRSAA